MKKIWIGIGSVIILLALVLVGSNNSLALGKKTPSPEIVTATFEALNPLAFLSEAEDMPETEETKFVIMYMFSPSLEKCELCQTDMTAMFETLLFNSDQVKKKQITLLVGTEVDKQEAVDYLTTILAQIFSQRKIEPSQIASNLQSIHLLIECKSDFSETEGMQMPIIGIIDYPKEDEGNIYISSGALGPWSKFDQIILNYLQKPKGN